MIKKMASMAFATIASATIVACGVSANDELATTDVAGTGSDSDAASNRARELCTGPGLSFAENYGPAQLIRYYPTSEAGLQRWEDDRLGVATSGTPRGGGATMAVCYYTDVLVEKGPPPDSGIPAEPYNVMAVVVDAEGDASIYSASPSSKKNYEDAPPPP